MKKRSFILLLLALIAFGKPMLKAQAPAQCQDVMLQAFYWDSYADSKWTTLHSKIDEIAPVYSLVWLPPSGNCQSSASMGYAPIWWFDQNSAFGSSNELKTLITSLNSRGSKVLADVVVNHRSGATNWTDFPTEVYSGVTYSMGPAQICSTDEVANQPGQATPTGAPDTGEDFNGSRDLDHLSTVVRSNVKGYMQFLKNDMGYSGWRYDMTKGYSAFFVNEYNNAAGGYFSVGEYFDGSYDLCKTWLTSCSNNSTTFDFPLKFALNAAMWNGGMNLTQLVWLMNGTTPQPAGLIHHTDTKRYAVTFVDNHDTYVTGNANRFSGNIRAAYAFLMGSPGVPCVLLAHWNSYKTDIFNMIAARRAVKLHSQSVVTVNQYSANLYVSTATGMNGSLIIKIGSGSYTPPSGYVLAASGTDYSMWKYTNNPVAPMLMVTPSGGTYYTTQTVTATASAGASVYYTTNNTPPTNASNLYSIPIIVSGTTTLRIIAYDPATHLYSPEMSNTYTIASMPSSIKVRFKAPVGWTACKVYSWTGTAPLCGAWPGTSMTLENDGYYTYTVTGFTTLPIGVVFNNGATSGIEQTVDLFTTTDMCWDAGPMSGGKYTATEVACPSVGMNDPANIRLNISPNPTHGQIHITVPGGIRGVTVTSVMGRKLDIEPKWTGDACQIDLSCYPSGVYYITLSGVNGFRVTKAVVKY
ncbi:MAG: alpha-amylase family glycosyl hydrolase [Bacteroidetes bacterium]|nr:alpha-amylase family glycosyl hydrolase [Bacteroidota bacterium]